MKRKVYFVTIIYRKETDTVVNIYQFIDKKSKSGMIAMIATIKKIEKEVGEPIRLLGNAVTELTPEIFKII